MPKRPASFVDVLRTRAAETPDRMAYRFRDADSTITLTHAELDRRVRAVAVAVKAHASPGDRVLLLFPPGPDFIVAFLGCFYAGAVAVPMYPPHPARRERARAHLGAIATDARPTAALTVRSFQPLLEELASPLEPWARVRILSVDAPDEALADAWRPSALDPQATAFLQYTSGSMSSPKGVMVTHDNLISNNEAIFEGFGMRPDEDSVATWLPPYHDMGLIGTLLHPLFAGYPSTVLAPAAFLQQPFRWLETMSTYRATISGAPNFAFELAASRITEDQLARLNLRRWRLAFTGAEPVRADTLERFARTFAPCGFRIESFLPCYGMAESTLLISVAAEKARPIVAAVDADALARGRADTTEDAAPGSPGVRRFVGCGTRRTGHEILIVDPETRTPCGEDVIGEIWTRGPSVAVGYWNRPDETAAAFGGRLATGDGPFLRTGDLGFLRGGELFVTGRLKSLIIIDGRNLYPQDLERTAETSHPGVRTGGAAAFTIESDGEQLVMAIEVDRRLARQLPDGARSGDGDAAAGEIIAAVRTAIARDHDVRVHDVMLLPPAGLPRTSSGKIQRHLCRDAYVTQTVRAASE